MSNTELRKERIPYLEKQATVKTLNWTRLPCTTITHNSEVSGEDALAAAVAVAGAAAVGSAAVAAAAAVGSAAAGSAC